MARFTEMFEHPSELMSRKRAARLARRASETMHERPGSIVGLVAIVAVVLGVVWMWPEIQRYMKIERM